jgi:hypothetical protein
VIPARSQPVNLREPVRPGEAKSARTGARISFANWIKSSKPAQSISIELIWPSPSAPARRGGGLLDHRRRSHDITDHEKRKHQRNPDPRWCRPLHKIDLPRPAGIQAQPERARKEFYFYLCLCRDAPGPVTNGENESRQSQLVCASDGAPDIVDHMGLRSSRS